MTVATQNPCINLLSPGLNTGPRIALSPYRPACGVFNRPAALKAIAQHGATHAKAPSAFGNNHSLATPSDKDVFPRIAVLSRPCGPAAIVGRIALAVVDAVKGVSSAGVLAHVFKEIGERQPPVANSDSASAIMAIRLGVRIQAAALHVGPSPIGLCLFHRNICSALPR